MNESCCFEQHLLTWKNKTINILLLQSPTSLGEVLNLQLFTWNWSNYYLINLSSFSKLHEALGYLVLRAGGCVNIYTFNLKKNLDVNLANKTKYILLWSIHWPGIQSKNNSYHIHKGREETTRRKIENANLQMTDYLFELRLMFAKINLHGTNGLVISLLNRIKVIFENQLLPRYSIIRCSSKLRD